MRKIFDWTVGSFFRTIGRTIAFLVMACLLYYILSYNDISFGIKDLFFDRVSASSFTSQYLGSLSYRNGANSSTSYSMSLGNDGFWTTNLVYGASGYTFNRIIYVQFPSQVSLSGNKKELSFQIKFMRESSDSESDTSGTRRTHCDYHYIEEVYDGRIEPVIDQVDCNETGLLNSQEFQSHFSLSVAYTYNQNDYSYSPCYAKGQSGDNFTFTCPVTTNNISGLKISTNVSDIDASQYRFGVYPLWSVESDTTQDIIDAQNQNTQAITNQTLQQQQQHQEVMNSSTTDAENDASSFFGNFTVEDQGGLSAIVTAPLNTIRSLLSSSCSNLVLPLPFVNENLTLPCLAPIYSQHFGAFFTLYQTIILGIIAYRCIMSIFFDIKGFTNPNDDRIEVMDL